MTNSVHGKTELSLRRKKTSTQASQSSTISSDIKFAHQLSAGDTSIPLDALVLPVQMPTFVNPTSVEIAQANVKANAANLILVSSLRGTLVCDLSYKVVSNTIINLEFEAEENEIIIGQFRATQSTGQLVEGRLWSVTGTLAAGNTDFNLGQAFTTNANPDQQIGEFIVFVDGIQQYRNVGNAAADILADGNFEEVDAGGTTSVIRFNDTFIEDVAITVVPASLIVTTSDLALQPQLDALAGQIDAMVPTLADLAGVAESEFQAAPNSVDLKAFGDKVQQNKNDIEANTTDISNILDLEVMVDQGEVQEYFVPNQLTSTTSIIHTFSGLEVGRVYQISGVIQCRVSNSADNGYVIFYNNNTISDTIVGRTGQYISTSTSSDNLFQYSNINIKFTAINPFLSIRAVVSEAGRIEGDGTRGNSFVQLQKMAKKSKLSDLI